MLEVFFSESAKHSRQQSKNIEHPNAIISLDFHLDIGDISNGINVPGREEVFNQVFSRSDLAIQWRNLEKLLSAAKEGKTIRIWKSDAPFSACGFAFLCDQLREIDCEISVVSLPTYVVSSADTLTYYNDWGEVSPDEFTAFLAFEKKLTQIEKEIQSTLWQKLIVENSSLRAIVNGQLLSVPLIFYDHLIFDNLPEEDFIMEELIAKILGKYPIGVSDAWYAYRIMRLVKDEEL